MTRYERVYVSHNRLEWWYAHLRTALAADVEIIDCPMARFNQAGHPLDMNITELLADDDGETSLYLGSLDQMFAGLADLRMPTAIWTDYLHPVNRNFLPCLRLFDVVFCSQKESVEHLTRAGIRHCEWLPFGVDTTLCNDPEADKIYDVGFVGNLALPPTQAERTTILARLENRYRMNEYRQPVFGDDMMRVYNQSRIVVNIPAAGGLNMRTFEAMAAGALLITKPVGNGQDDLFREGTHLVTYRTSDDLIDTIDYYLHHEEERRAIANAGRCEVLAHHTYEHRAARLLDVMERAQYLRGRDTGTRIAAYSAFYSYVGRPDLQARLAIGRDVAALTRLRLLTRAARKWGGLAVRRWGGS